MNKAILMGRLTRDPEIKYTQGENSICIARYTLAVDRRGPKKENEQSADYISIVSFGKAGEFIEKYCTKGTKLTISGHIQTGSYTNKDGAKIYTTEVVTEEIEFAESKRSQGDGSADNTQAQGSRTNEGGFVDIPEGVLEDLPFSQP